LDQHHTKKIHNLKFASNLMLEQDAKDLVKAAAANHRPKTDVKESPIVSEVAPILFQTRDHSRDFAASTENQ
jgi:hypothetical protein